MIETHSLKQATHLHSTPHSGHALQELTVGLGSYWLFALLFMDMAGK
jgi:hypothetical protein